MQALHSLPVQVRELGVKPRSRCRSLLHLCRKLPLARLEREQLLLHAGRAQAVFDGLDNRTDLPLDSVEFLLLAFVVASRTAFSRFSSR